MFFDFVVLLHCIMETVFSFEIVGHELNVLLQIHNLESGARKRKPKVETFFIKHGARTRKLETVKFLWKLKHFEERSWKRKQTLKRLTLKGTGSEKYSTASTSLTAG